MLPWFRQRRTAFSPPDRAVKSIGSDPSVRSALCGSSHLAGLKVEQIALSLDFVCMLLADGKVSCWSRRPRDRDDDAIKPGIGPVPEIVMQDAVAIAAGWNHACAIARDRSVWCWGSNADGQLGDGTNQDRPRPVPVRTIRSTVQIAAGENHACALSETGTVECWGANTFGQLGIGVLPYTGDDDPDKERKNPGSRARPQRVQGLDPVVEIALGNDHGCARVRDGKLYCWGRNEAGQTGRLELDDSGYPIGTLQLAGQVGVGPVRQVVAAGHYTCALETGGAVKCWGALFLPNATERPSHQPAPVSW
jgi:alpha-tubulin suppressor-like RCC1 family protein